MIYAEHYCHGNWMYMMIAVTPGGIFSEHPWQTVTDNQENRNLLISATLD